jgi:hypothetical protein
MALGKRAYLHLFNFALFGAFTLLTVLTDLRLTLGFAALAVAQALLAMLVLRRPGAQRSALMIRGFLGATLFAVAYCVAAIGGAPNTLGFWVIFSATAAIFLPIALMGWRRRATWVARTRASARGASRRRG